LKPEINIDVRIGISRPTVERSGVIFATHAGVGKHNPGSCKRLQIPVAQILVKGSSAVKHPLHIGYFFCIPVADILIEKVSFTKHFRHLFCISGIPVTGCPD
jgi:hypothetical protein